MKLFEYAIIYVPLDDDENIRRDDARIVLEPKVTLAADERAVTLRAAKEIPDDLDLDFVQVVVRPF